MSNGKVAIDLSITLDGYIAGSNDSVAQPLGDGVRLFGDGDTDEREADKGERGALKAITLNTPRVVEGAGVTHMTYEGAPAQRSEI